MIVVFDSVVEVDVNLASGNFEESLLVIFQFFELLLDEGYTSLMACAFSDLTRNRGQSPRSRVKRPLFSRAEVPHKQLSEGCQSRTT